MREIICVLMLSTLLQGCVSATERARHQDARNFAGAFIHITSFDCHASAEDKNMSLREWAGGGPQGAVSNIWDNELNCDIEIASKCDGEADITALVTSGPPSSMQPIYAKFQLHDTQTKGIRIDIPYATWQPALVRRDAPMDTLLLISEVSQVCKSGELREELWSFSSDIFTAGIAEHE
jgi:hypothetical protein